MLQQQVVKGKIEYYFNGKRISASKFYKLRWELRKEK